MSKRIFIMIPALIMLLACGGKKTQVESVDTAVADSTEVKAKEEIVGLINGLYSAINQGGEDIDGRFACHAWQDMVARVEEVDSKLVEIGFFNEDYWTMMQDTNPDDFEVRDIQFDKLDVEKATATVNFILHSSVQTIHQGFTFCREDGDWRVHDIIQFYDDPDGKEDSSSYMEGMQSYLNEGAVGYEQE